MKSQVDKLGLLGTKPEIWGQFGGNLLTAADPSFPLGCGNQAPKWIHWKAGEMRDELLRNVPVPAPFPSPGTAESRGFSRCFRQISNQRSRSQTGEFLCLFPGPWKENQQIFFWGWESPRALLPPFGSTRKTPSSQTSNPGLEPPSEPKTFGFKLSFVF